MDDLKKIPDGELLERERAAFEVGDVGTRYTVAEELNRRMTERREAETARVERAKRDAYARTPEEADAHVVARGGLRSGPVRPPAPLKLAEQATDDSAPAFAARVQAIHDAGANPPTSIPRAEGGDAYLEHPEVYRRRLASIGVTTPEPSPYAVAKWERDETSRLARDSAERERTLVEEIKGMREQLAKLQAPPPAPAPPPTERDVLREGYYRSARRRVGLEG